MILSALVVLAVLLDAVRLRSRASSLRVLSQASPPGGPPDCILPAGSDNSGASLVTAAGVKAENGWGIGDDDVLDLIPPDLPTSAAIDLLNAVDPKKYPTDPWTRGVSAGQAILTRHPANPDPSDPTEFTAFIRNAKEHVGRKVDIAVAPGLRSAYNLQHRAALLRQNGKRPAIWTTNSIIGYAIVTTAVVLAWPWGLIAAAAYCLHPALALAGSPLRPKDLWRATLLKPLTTPHLWYRTRSVWRSTQERRQQANLEAATPWYENVITTITFHEPQRDDCPNCGSKDLRTQVKSVDLIQRKPGEFTLDRCVRCGHVWQNPRLTEEALGYYYRDFYDGLGEGAADAVFSIKNDPYYGRAEMVKQQTRPNKWLDVGSGHAHFCLAAKEVLPDTTFDGLDQGASIDEAAEKGRIDTAYRGSFKDFAPELRGRYDVISMHHYLEHVRDPWEELDIAADVLPEGGYLLIELPDPEWKLGHKFGRYWMPWFQPQHQHMMPIENLKHALKDRHLETVSEERGKAHMCNDFMLAALLFLGAHAPRTPAPWRPEKPRFKAVRSALIWTLGIPLFGIAALLDATVNKAIGKKNDRGNAYRVLARKEAA